MRPVWPRLPSQRPKSVTVRTPREVGQETARQLEDANVRKLAGLVALQQRALAAVHHRQLIDREDQHLAKQSCTADAAKDRHVIAVPIPSVL